MASRRPQLREHEIHGERERLVRAGRASAPGRHAGRHAALHIGVDGVSSLGEARCPIRLVAEPGRPGHARLMAGVAVAQIDGFAGMRRRPLAAAPEQRERDAAQRGEPRRLAAGGRQWTKPRSGGDVSAVFAWAIRRGWASAM